MAAIKYSSNTATKSISVPFVYGFTLSTRGDGSKPLFIAINPKTSGAILILTGNAKLYTNEACTTGETQSKTLNHNTIGSTTTYYVKLTSGTAKMYVNTKRIDEVWFQCASAGEANVPLVSGDFSNWVNISNLYFRTKTNFSSSVTKVCNSVLKSIELDTSYNEGVVTGMITGAINATKIKFIDYINRISANLLYITGDLTNCVAHPWIELVDHYGTAIDVIGNLTNVDPELFYGDTSGFYGDGSLWTKCYYIEDAYSNVNFDTILSMTKLGYFQIKNKVFTQAQVNQFAIDFLANIDVVKGYAPSEQMRTFDISGLLGTPAPSSAEAIAAIAAIRAWRGTNGQYVNVVTR